MSPTLKTSEGGRIGENGNERAGSAASGRTGAGSCQRVDARGSGRAGPAESDTPRRAGGLMSWAASKAVGVLSRRRALRASVRSSELPAGTIRGVLLADVLAHLLQVESDCGHRVTAGPEVFAGEVSLLSAQACNRNGTLPLQEPNHRGDWVLGWNRDTHVHRVRHQMPFHNLAFLLFRQRVENCSQLLAYLPEDHFPAPFGNEYHVILAVPLGVG